ncbi:MAG: hypothetical protein JWR07_1135 [Nevskia sp.]|nr:hypothetical protein [Nevskia sp.]
MDKPASRETPLTMPRRFAIRLLHEAQLAGEHPFIGVVGAGAEPDLYVPLVGPATLNDGVAHLDERQRALWAIYLHRPGQPTAPAPEDFAERPQTLRLTSSLATKGVLQLRAWTCTEGKVRERELHLSEQ